MITVLKYLLTWALLMLVAALFAAIINQQFNPLKWAEGSLFYLITLAIALLISAIVAIRRDLRNPNNS